LLLREQEAATDEFLTATAVYRAPVRRVIDVVQLPSRVWLCPPAARLLALAALAGEVELAPLAEVAAALLASVAAARRSGLWDRDAGLRFDAAEVEARVEAAIAMVELADPDRRAETVGPAPAVAWTDVHRARYAYAVSWHALELGQAVHVLALRTGARLPALPATLAAISRALDRARTTAAASLGRGADP
jgi:hypothetical protein